MQAATDMTPQTSAEPGERILVVDDDPGIRDVVSEFLQRHGYRVQTAADGREMDRSLARSPADVVLRRLVNTNPEKSNNGEKQ